MCKRETSGNSESDPPSERDAFAFQEGRAVRSSRPRGRWLWAAALLVSAACAWNIYRGDNDRLPSSPPSQPVGHQRMLVALNRIANVRGSGYLGDRGLETWRSRLASLSAEAPDAQRFQILVMLSQAEAHHGNELDAIKYLKAAHGLLPKVDVPAHLGNEIRYRLGLAFLRHGETQNCCALHSSDSCIMPIRGEGIHTMQEGSRNAIQYFGEVLESASADDSQRLKAKWLMNLAYMTLGEYPDNVPIAYRIPISTFQSDEPWPRFVNIVPQLNLNTFNLCGGAIVDDFNGDGSFDIVTSSYDTAEQMRFFVNNGDGSFTDKTDEAGLTGLLGGLNLEQADFDNDGHTDILVLRGAWLGSAGKHPNSLIRNNGNGTFTDVTLAAGLADESYPTQAAAWADYDNDGDLDLYIGNEHVDGTHAPSQLFRNNGDGTFTDVAEEAGVRNLRFAKGVSWGDFNSDRYPDLYVSNMRGPNRLYRNNHDGTFSDVAEELSVTRPIDGFPTWFWDFDNDGALDIYAAANPDLGDAVASVAASYLELPFDQELLACLYRGDGKGGFEEVSARYGLTRLALPMGANFGDLDNDGYLDFYLGTGYPAYDALMPNVMFHNQSGQRFSDITWNGGFGHLQKGHGIAFADLDHDGDQDVYAQMGGALPGDRFNDALFENPGFGNNWISIKLVGKRSNRSAIGARIRVVIRETDIERSIYRHVNSGGSFGANPLTQTLGIGRSSQIERMEVYWPTTDTVQTFNNVSANQVIQVAEDVQRLTVLEFGSLQSD